MEIAQAGGAETAADTERCTSQIKLGMSVLLPQTYVTDLNVRLCRKTVIDKVDAGLKGSVISFRKDSFARPDRLVGWLTRQNGAAKIRPDQKIVLMRSWDDVGQRLQGVKTTLAELVALVA